MKKSRIAIYLNKGTLYITVESRTASYQQFIDGDPLTIGADSSNEAIGTLALEALSRTRENAADPLIENEVETFLLKPTGSTSWKQFVDETRYCSLSVKGDASTGTIRPTRQMGKKGYEFVPEKANSVSLDASAVGAGIRSALQIGQ